MKLTVRSVAQLLGITEKALYRMVEDGEIPAHLVHDQYRFHRTELLEWAMARGITLSPELLQQEVSRASEELPGLAQALCDGGVFYAVKGSDKGEALRSMVNAISLPEEVDRDLLLRMLLARESMASTGIGDGIAIPHVRNPVVVKLPCPRVALCFLENPVDFQAVDGKPVFALFSLVSPNVRIHLHLLSRLAFALQDSGVKETIQSRAPADRIIAQFARLEPSMSPAAGEREDAPPR